MKKLLAVSYPFVVCLLFAMPAHAGEFYFNPDPDEDPRPARLQLTAEAGFLAPLSHTFQSGKNGTRLDYVEDAGQRNLFPFARFTADVKLWERHHAVFLYQPLELRTRRLLESPLTVSGVTFEAGETVDFKYGFSFWRASYVYDLLRDAPWELGLGASLQIRNASITFTDVAGETSVQKENVGPVPALKVRLRHHPGTFFFWGFEADGIYASNKFINGASYNFTGALLDASVFAGFHLTRAVSVFLNVRYLGGGGEGTSKDRDNATDDGYTRNWLSTATVTLGLCVE